MKYFLFCIFGGLSLSAWAQSAADISEIQITKNGSEWSAKADASIEGRSYKCAGAVLATKFSVLNCGDQRQAQIEIQTFVEDTKALVAFYESGRQSGSLYVFEQSANGYVSSGAPAIFTPGFGSLNQFQMYVLEPMRKDASESSVFVALTDMIKAMGAMSLSQIRDRVVNREYRDFLPIPVPTPRGEQPWDKAQAEENARIEMARISEEMRVAEEARKTEAARVAAEKKAAEELAELEAKALEAQKALEEAKAKQKATEQKPLDPESVDSKSIVTLPDAQKDETPSIVEPQTVTAEIPAVPLAVEPVEQKKVEQKEEVKTPSTPKIEKPSKKPAVKKDTATEQKVKKQTSKTVREPKATSPKASKPKKSRKQPLLMRGDDPLGEDFDGF